MIKIQNITKIFNAGTDIVVTAIKDVNLEINSGEWYNIVGPNGSGKSTLLRLLAGEIQPNSGSIFLNGIDITPWTQEKRAKIFQFIEQDTKENLVPSMSVEENLLLPLYGNKFPMLDLARSSKRREKIVQCLSKFKMGLENRLSTQVKFLSGGQRQAVVVAKTILREAGIFLLDEFVAALDAKTAPRLLEVMQNETIKSNSIVIMVTHDLDQAVSCPGKLIFLNRGEVFYKSEKDSINKEKLLNVYSQALGD